MKYVNYTTTAAFANALTVTTGLTYRHLVLVNATGEDVEITFDNQNDVKLYLPAATNLVITAGLSIGANVRARYAAGGSGAAGLHITAW